VAQEPMSLSMKSLRISMLSFLLSALLLFGCKAADHDHQHHHHRHHHHQHHQKTLKRHEGHIMEKIKQLEAHLAEKAKNSTMTQKIGHILVNGPLPAGFAELFSRAVSDAAGVDTNVVNLMSTELVSDAPGIVVQIIFSGPSKAVKKVEQEAADPNSDLVQGALHSFLVAKEDDHEHDHGKPTAPQAQSTPKAVEQKGVDIDTQMPYGELEPFGREDTAQELTESAVTESNGMVDQLERAEVAEEKRSVFRALTRLRGAAITSFDGIARSQTGNIDEYNKIHKWRKAHPLNHLADEESDVSKWAFPSNADLIQMPNNSTASSKK